MNMNSYCTFCVHVEGSRFAIFTRLHEIDPIQLQIELIRINLYFLAMGRKLRNTSKIQTNVYNL